MEKLGWRDKCHLQTFVWITFDDLCVESYSGGHTDIGNAKNVSKANLLLMESFLFRLIKPQKKAPFHLLINERGRCAE